MTLNAHELAPEEAWFVSSYSGAGNNCVKVAAPAADRPHVGVCDSKQTCGPAFTVRPQAWKAFIASVA